jgi:hypothetical protein
MKTILRTLLIGVFISIAISEIKAQPTHNKPNQAILMKQFIGTWKGELGRDTFLISENKSFGTGMVSIGRVITKDICLDSIRHLYGYDKRTDKFILAELIKSSPDIEICNIWFTSDTEGEIVIVNPQNVNLRFKFEFKNPDMIVQQAISNEKAVKEIILTRVKP